MGYVHVQGEPIQVPTAVQSNLSKQSPLLSSQPVLSSHIECSQTLILY